MGRRTANAGLSHKVETDYADPLIGPAAVRTKVTFFVKMMLSPKRLAIADPATKGQAYS
jgi:hypothetical protein